MKRPAPSLCSGVVVLGLGVVACSTPTVVTTTNNFERPSDVAFLCLGANPASSAGPPVVLPTERCNINPADNSSATPGTNLFAVVTQAQHGELAIINLTVASGTALVDNSARVPGYTFIPVAALPTAVVSDVRTNGTPSSIWVASGAEHLIERLDASGVLSDPRNPANTALRRVLVRVPMDGSPRDLALDTLGGRTLLHATVPDRSVLMTWDITDPLQVGDPVVTPITVPVVGGRPDASTGADATADTGTLDGATSDASGTTDSGPDDAPPDVMPSHPLQLALDAERHRLYVSDDGSNYVHVLEGMPLRETARIDMGAPTLALALSGWAREVTCDASAADPDHYARARYLYATHATNGGVLVYDVTRGERGERVRPNILPAPNPERRPLDPSLPAERVAINAPVISLIPITSTDYRGVDGDGNVLVPAGCLGANGCRGTAAVDPTQLHGVFMGAVLRDGRVAVIDIDDYDAPSRGSASTGVSPYRFVRHAPRASTKLTEAPKVNGAPVATTLLRGVQRVTLGGSSANPGIACAPSRDPTGGACSDPAFGIALTPRLAQPPGFVVSPSADAGADPDASVAVMACGDAGGSDAATADAATDVVQPPDPYAQRNETWAFTWQGVIPGLDVYGGALTVDGTQLVLEAPGAGFCTRGAFADALARDSVTILGDVPRLPSSVGVSRYNECLNRFGNSTSLLNRNFVIEAASQDRLVLRTSGAIDPQLVHDCFPQAVHFEVRTSDTWLAQGTITGYQTAVTTDAMGRCVLDETKQQAVETLARACLTDRAPLAMRSGRRCLAGRACVADPDTMTGVVTAAATPVFANAFFCLQVFPGVEGMAGTYRTHAERDTRISFNIVNAWEPLVGQVTTGVSFPVVARYLPGVERFYVLDTQYAGLVEFRTTPFSRTRNFN